MTKPLSFSEYVNPCNSISAIQILRLESGKQTAFSEKAKVIAIGIIASLGAALAAIPTFGLGATPTFRWIVNHSYPLQRIEPEPIFNRRIRPPRNEHNVPGPPSGETPLARIDEIQVCPNRRIRPPRNEHNVPSPPSGETTLARIDEIQVCPSGIPLQAELPQIAIDPSDANRVKIDFPQVGPSQRFDVTIRNQDLFASGAEVIVNAANTDLRLKGNGGINAAILRRGGDAYKEAHAQLRDLYHQNFPSGAAALLPSGDLQADGFSHVAVVAGPLYTGRITKQDRNSLYSCYYNSLVLAHEAEKTSIAFSSISTGIYNFPKQEAARISTWAILHFIQDYPDSPTKTISIHFLNGRDLLDYLHAFG
ncbi:MAG: macro domain-containing protein [Chlamydiales bacterium]|nr:macro domain-containing protein [Chlamydiales bacterium]